jgi:hypothetical protein
MMIMRPPQQGQERFAVCGAAALVLIALMALTGMIGGASISDMNGEILLRCEGV